MQCTSLRSAVRGVDRQNHQQEPAALPASSYPALDLGPLPVDLINSVLGTELDPGHARLSSTAHRHIAEDHAAEYPVIIAALQADAIGAPTFIGQDPSHAGNFVLVKRIGLPDGRAVLVAIGLEMAPGGTYSVRSSYLIPQRTIDARRQAGRLKIPPLRHDKGPA